MAIIKTGYWKFTSYDVFDNASLSSYALEQTPLKFIPTTYKSEDYSKYYIIWDFGDGSAKVSGLSSTHAYYYPGQYQVTMTVMLSSGSSVLDSYNNTVTIRDFVPNTFAFNTVDSTETITLTAGVYSPQLTLTRFNSLQSFSSNGYSFFLAASGCNSLNYDIPKLTQEPYAHLLPTHRFIQRELVNTLYSDTIVDKVKTIDTNLYGKLDAASLVVPTSASDVNAFFVGTSGYCDLYFVDDFVQTEPYYILATIDTSKFPDNYTLNFNLPTNYELPIKNSTSTYYQISSVEFKRPDRFNITSNGLDGEGFNLTTFYIDQSKFINQKISFVAKLKYSNQYSSKHQFNLLSQGYSTFALNSVKLYLTDPYGNSLGNIEPYLTIDTSIFENYHYGWVKGNIIIPEDNDLNSEYYLDGGVVCLSAVCVLQDIDPNDSFVVSGSSQPFHLYPKSGSNKVAKINENFDATNYMKSLAFQPSIYQLPVLFDTFFSSMLGTVESNTNSIGKRVYEKTSNFIKNTSNIDTCDIQSLYGYAQMYNLDLQQYANQDLLINYPADLARLVNLFSIKKSLLFGKRLQKQDNFADKYNLSYRANDLTKAAQDYSVDKKYGNNLGNQINVHNGIVYKNNNYVIVYEIFSETYRVMRTNISSISLSSYPLSTYNSSWGWGLSLPDDYESDSLSAYKLSCYYNFYEFVPVVPGKFVGNIINWEDTYGTTIDLLGTNPLSTTYMPWYLSSYRGTALETWDDYGGVVDQNLNYQLSLGLDLLSAT